MTNEIKYFGNADEKENEDRKLNDDGDLARGKSFLLLWAPPIALSILGSVLYQSGWVSFTSAAIMWTTSTAWIGITCLINGVRCGRLHCVIDGALLPVLSIAGILSFFGIIPFDWNYYGAFFWAIVIASFAAECLWRPYIHKPAGSVLKNSCC